MSSWGTVAVPAGATTVTNASVNKTTVANDKIDWDELGNVTQSANIANKSYGTSGLTTLGTITIPSSGLWIVSAQARVGQTLWVLAEITVNGTAVRRGQTWADADETRYLSTNVQPFIGRLNAGDRVAFSVQGNDAGTTSNDSAYNNFTAAKVA